jgi:hypothetical protein
LKFPFTESFRISSIESECQKIANLLGYKAARHRNKQIFDPLWFVYFFDKLYDNLHYLGMIVFIVLAYPGFIHIISCLLQFCIYLINSGTFFTKLNNIVTILLRESSLFYGGGEGGEGGTEDNCFSWQKFG